MEYRPWRRAFILVLACNGAFAALLLAANLVPRDVIVARIREAFASGDLGDHDRLLYDSQRGYNQHNDCSILQMMTNADDSLVARSFGPRLRVDNRDYKNMCRTLHALIVDGRDPTTLTSSRYTRYWHGYIPVAAALLSTFDLATARRVMRAAVYASLLCLGIAGIRRPRLLPLVGPLVIAGSLFWGLPSFALSFCHAPGDGAVVLGIACVVLWCRGLSRPAMLIPFSAAYGAVVTYFDMLSGALPTAAGLLFPAVYLVSRSHRESDSPPGGHLGLAGLALAAFALGAVLTVVYKVAVVLAWVRPTELGAMAGNLDLYTGAVRSDSPLPSVILPLAHLLKQGLVLTDGSRAGMLLLYASAGLGWLLGAWRAYASGSTVARMDWAAFAIGAASVPAWSLILPTHTFNHAEFVARILIVPIALGWAAALWQLARKASPSPH